MALMAAFSTRFFSMRKAYATRLLAAGAKDKVEVDVRSLEARIGFAA